ncbi:MAG: hypothetical protein PGN08_16745 [Sphingomonas taxi]
MAASNFARPALIALAGTLAIAAIGSAGVRLWRRRPTKHDDSIEPRRLPASAADIHVAGGVPVKRP